MDRVKAPEVCVQLTNRDGNVFSVIGSVVKELKRAGHVDLAKEYQDACFKASSYDEVLRITMGYVEVT